MWELRLECRVKSKVLEAGNKVGKDLTLAVKSINQEIAVCQLSTAIQLTNKQTLDEKHQKKP